MISEIWLTASLNAMNFDANLSFWVPSACTNCFPLQGQSFPDASDVCIAPWQYQLTVQDVMPKFIVNVIF